MVGDPRNIIMRMIRVENAFSKMNRLDGDERRTMFT